MSSEAAAERGRCPVGFKCMIGPGLLRRWLLKDHSNCVKVWGCYPKAWFLTKAQTIAMHIPQFLFGRRTTPSALIEIHEVN